MDHTEPESKRDSLSGKAWTALVCTGLFFIVVTWVVASLLTARPSVDPTVHADAVALANSQQPDPNAPSRYTELAKALEEFLRELDGATQRIATTETPWGDGEKEIVFESIYDASYRADVDPALITTQAAEAREVLDYLEDIGIIPRIEELLQHPNLGNDYKDAFNSNGELLPMFDWQLPELDPWRMYARVAIARSKIALEEDGPLAAAQILDRSARMPSVLTRQITLVEHLVGNAISELFAREIEALIVQSNPGEEALDTLRSAIESLRERGDFELSVKGELLLIRDAHFRSHTAGGRFIPSADYSAPRATPADSLAERLSDVSGYLVARRDSSLAKAEKLTEMVVEMHNEPDPVVRHRMSLDIADEWDSLGPRYPVLEFMMPAYHGLSHAALRAEADALALNILLAMAEYRLDSGDWPESVDHLVPDYLDAIPTNPITGDPFEYDHEPGQPPSLERLGAGI